MKKSEGVRLGSQVGKFCHLVNVVNKVWSSFIPIIRIENV